MHGKARRGAVGSGAARQARFGRAGEAGTVGVGDAVQSAALRSSAGFGRAGLSVVRLG